MRSLTKLLSLLILFVMSPLCDVYKILVVSPLPIKSHGILANAYIKLLLEAGYEITHITGSPSNTSHPHLREIDVSYNIKHFTGSGTWTELLCAARSKTFCSTLQHKDVDRLLKNTKQRFDLVIAEWMFNDNYCYFCFTGLAELYDCPFIWFSTTEPDSMVLRTIYKATNPIASSSMSKILSPFAWTYLMNEEHLRKLEEEAYKNQFGPLIALRGKSLQSFDEWKYITSPVLVNSHITMDEETPWPHNFKPIAGFHIDRNVKPLPKHLKTIMDNATDGVIYFSLGSRLKSQGIPNKLKQKLILMFSALKQTVIWKLELNFPNLPSNVHIFEWAPQQSILSHPNCILFITHGGLLSITESIHFGVPIVGVPIFVEQGSNVERAVRKNLGKKVELSYSMVEELKVAIEEMLSNPSYRKRVKELSRMYYHDRVMSPAVELVHWVNQIVQVGHRRLLSRSADVPFYRNIYLDLAVVVVVILILIKFAIRWYLNATFMSKAKVE